MEFPSKLIEQAVGEVSKLPNIGKKTALRLVLHLLKKDETHTLALADALVNLRTHVQYCQQCHNLSDAPLCALCANPHRDHALVCVVQDIRDVMAIENTGQYRGLYHVLGGIISPVEGIGPNDLNVESLVRRVALAAPPADHLAERAPDYGTPAPEPVKEIIFALSATMEGDTTAFYLTKRLRPYGVRVSTISRGVPVGGDLEFADEITLGRSIVSRINYE